MYDIIIVGAGASGLSTAAYAVLRKPETRILVIEKSNKCGRKLSASGNGKCNLTNALFEQDCYNSNDSEFVESFINKHSSDDVISFFDKCGILTYEKDGYYYPVSNQAKQVTSKLIDICIRNGVELINNSCVKNIHIINESNNIGDSDNNDNIVDNDEENKDNSVDKYNHFFKVATDESEYISRNVIIACGSSASPELGGSDSGYKLVKKMGLSISTLYPVLSPIYVNDNDLHLAKRVRLNGVITLKHNDLTVKEEGQIQINSDNLSGIALMNLSCILPSFVFDNKKDSFYIDVLPDISWDNVRLLIDSQRRDHKNENVGVMLEGFFPRPFVNYILKRTRLDYDMNLDKLTDKQINKLSSNIKKLTFIPRINTDYGKSQVTLGGVDINEIDINSYESKKYPGLYIIGEILDMTGKCGGYNISFAVISALSAVDSILSCNKA